MSALIPDNAGPLLETAIAEARAGMAEGGIPIGSAFYSSDGRELGRGRNRRVQDADPSAHAETNAFRAVGRRATYDDTILVTTLAPCMFCTGLILQFRIPVVIMGDAVNVDTTHLQLLESAGVQVIDAASSACIDLLAEWIPTHMDLFAEDGGHPPDVVRTRWTDSSK